MAEIVRLTVKTGPHEGRRFCFRGPTTCLIGRAPDCFVRFDGYERDSCISRHHFQLHIDPPDVHVQDLGSRNGTYVNGQAIDEAGPDAQIGNVRNGDIITFGGTSLVVDIVDCPDRPDMGRDPEWKEGEVAKEDCPIPCLADGSMPFVGCCVGGFGALWAS